MNSELNPAFFKVSGKRCLLLKIASGLSFGLVDAVTIYESKLLQAARNRISNVLKQCSLVVVHDPETAEELRKSGYPDAIVGSDTAILQSSSPKPPMPVLPDIQRIGFCISAQRSLQQPQRLVALWKKLLENPTNRLVLIPMNPKTDRELMAQLARQLPQTDRIEMLEQDSPDIVQACAAQCRVIVSSRLHLLILSSNVGLPGIGIAHGSKVDNWLKNFGQVPVGDVDHCDFDAMLKQINDILAQPSQQHQDKINAIMSQLHTRLDNAAQQLKVCLES